MLKNYLHFAFRNLKNNRTYSVINIVGLAVGIACCIAIMLYVQDELSYDAFNTNANQIYRICLKGLINNHELNSAVSAAPMGSTLKHDLPEVVSYTRLRHFNIPVVRFKDKIFSESRFFWVDSTFFDLFSVKFIEGNPKTALTKPNSIVITEATARKYFNNNDAIGKILNIDNKRDCVVTGVVKGFPHNSHFHFDFLGSLCTFEESRNPFWLSFNYYTYLLLREGTDQIRFEKEVPNEFIKYAGPQLKQSMGISLDQFEAAGNKFDFFLQPLTSIHLYSHLDAELGKNGDISNVYIFSAIAIAILFIACINFINLTTARSEKRVKEVGIRKTLGANRAQLVRLFITESILMTAFAVVIAIGLIELLLPSFNNITGKEMSLSVFGNLSTVSLLIFFTIFVGFAAGIYPAFYLSSHEPIHALKSKMITAERKTFLRSGLVIFQFTISIILLIATFVIYSQLKYIQNKDLGFNKEELIVINGADHLGDKTESFKREFFGSSNVTSVSVSTAIPGNQQGSAGFWVQGTSSRQVQRMCFMYSDYNFLKTYQLKLVSGRFLSKEHPSDTTAVVINQAAEKAFGVKNIVGKYLVTPGRSQSSAQAYQVIGVIKDFNFESLHEFVQPLIIGLIPSEQVGNFISVRVAPGDYTSILPFLESSWKKYSGNEIFDYNFLDQNLVHLYAAEQSTSRIVAIFSALAIFVACLGLLGLAAFVTQRRTKEIGIRKVLGASVPGLIFPLTKEFTKWVLIANIIAWPVAYYVMHNWLKDFAYRINISWWLFILAGGIAFIIALLTVSFQAIKAATANPVKSLKCE